jgi:site-specific recombinase XerD
MGGKWFVFTTCAQSLSHKNITLNNPSRKMKSPLWGKRRGSAGTRWSSQRFPSAPMTPEDSQTETGEVLLARFDLLEGTSESTRAKTAETFLELMGARVRNPNTRSAYRVAWRSFLAFCSARQLELESVKAYHVGSWLDQHPGSRSTQRQHLAAVRLLFDLLMMRGVVEYNPAARARPPRLVRESSQTPVFEEAEIVAFLDSISLESLKDIRDKAIFCVLLYSWCRVSALINLTVADYYERGGTRWLRFQEKRGKDHEVPVRARA